MKKIEKVAVIGAGEMGHGIGEVFAIAGYRVSLIDVSDDALRKALDRIQESLNTLYQKGRIKEPVQDVMNRISTAKAIKDGVSDAGLVIEAVPEDYKIKVSVLSEAEKWAPEDAILATNTSNMLVSELAEPLKLKERFLGLHFFNPPVVMKLVEVIRGQHTSDNVYEVAYELVKGLGKVPVRVKDSVGFIVNRILAPELLYLCMLVDSGKVVPAEVDTFFRSQGMPMGLYELMDFVGLDVVYDSLKYYAEKLSPEYGKCKKIEEMVSSGLLGKKSGRGFYEWEGGKAKIPPAQPTEKVSLLDVMAIQVNEASKLLEAGIASPDDIETAVKLGLNLPFGPITVAKSVPAKDIKEKLEAISRELGCAIFEPTSSIKEGKLRELIEGRPVQEKKEVAQGPVVMKRVSERVVRVEINRPKLNLISPQVVEELERVVDQLASDRETWVVIISGAGENFSAGADLSTYFSDQVQFMEFSRKGERVFRKITELPQITIAEVKGYALGGGFELALACDIRVASQGSTLGFPEVTLGLVPGWGGTQRLPKLAGMSRALDLILTGRRISGAEAYQMGIVNRIIEGDPDQWTDRFAQELAGTVAPVAARLAKQLVNKASEVPMDIGLDMESTSFGVLFGTQDLKEGVSSLLQKRKPQYKGR